MIKYYYRKYLLRRWPDVSAIGGPLARHTQQTRELSKIEGAFTSSILSCNDNKSFEEYFVDKDGRIRGIITTSSYEARAFGVKIEK